MVKYFEMRGFYRRGNLSWETDEEKENSVYLKALEIQGFKSFADKTRLTFEKEITAVVGPNGAGKSNLSDAILWVMGEQRTKTLRGSKMEDVIFGGSALRSPMGFAEVSLIIDNSARIFDSDSPEVELTRRYYRSGESEYYINREQVRLKDINALLFDTGLGRDGYSVIGQGKIADIISTKSTDRREVFDEAAGISRYRYRKEEAERRLERTDENLLRIHDKIEELELQVGPLKEQSEKAKQYLLLRDDLRIREISAWMTTRLIGYTSALHLSKLNTKKQSWRWKRRKRIWMHCMLHPGACLSGCIVRMKRANGPENASPRKKRRQLPANLLLR